MSTVKIKNVVPCEQRFSDIAGHTLDHQNDIFDLQYPLNNSTKKCSGKKRQMFQSEHEHQIHEGWTNVMNTDRDKPYFRQ